MKRLGTIEEARAKVLSDAYRCMEHVRRIAALSFETPEAAACVLKQLRETTYEDLNQIQHEHLIICAVGWLLAESICGPETEWHWNPRQTGDSSEPDLAGRANGSTVVSAEITTSANPAGVIDTRMRKTLSKLSQQDGQLFYFVPTKAMATRAATKIHKAGWGIRVVQLP